jgi:hypothetical protein
MEHRLPEESIKKHGTQEISMQESGTYWIELKSGEYITANWNAVTLRWSFNDNDDVLTAEEIAALGHTVLVRREGDERIEDLMQRYRQQK